MKFFYCCGLLAAFLLSVEGACFDQPDCEACTNHVGYFYLSCKWCPFSNTCHTYGSLYNDCGVDDAVTEQSKCEVRLESRPYSQTLANQLAHWSALAYADPETIDPVVLQQTLNRNLTGQYKVLKFIEKDCATLFNYPPCLLLVAISNVEKNVIVSFSGTQNNEQLSEQLMDSLERVQSNISGEVLNYNQAVHNELYPCLKEYLTSLLRANPHHHLTVTGHSLGGAQAQLAAATLVNDGVISSNRLVVYTFGSPRFADSEFATAFNDLVKTNWRLVQLGDPVPRIPPSYNFFYYNLLTHTHSEVWFNRSGVTFNSPYTICTANEDSRCALSQTSLVCLTTTCLNKDIGIHKDYFIRDMGNEFSGQKLVGSRTASQSSVGSCDSFDFSQQ